MRVALISTYVICRCMCLPAVSRRYPKSILAIVGIWLLNKTSVFQCSPRPGNNAPQVRSSLRIISLSAGLKQHAGIVSRVSIGCMPSAQYSTAAQQHALDLELRRDP
jgi:hypothetical protein